MVLPRVIMRAVYHEGCGQIGFACQLDGIFNTLLIVVGSILATTEDDMAGVVPFRANDRTDTLLADAQELMRLRCGFDSIKRHLNPTISA